MRSHPYREARGVEWTPVVFAIVSLSLFLGACLHNRDENIVARASDQLFQLTTITDGLNHPWSLAFMPGGDLLVTERPGRLRRVRNGVLDPEPVAGLPPIAALGQGGLLDVVLDPAFASNQLIYLSYAAGNRDTGYGTEVLRARISDAGLEESRVIFVAEPKSQGGRHFGSRLLFDNEGLLFVTLGDRGERANSQDLSTHPGSVIRITPDGDVPKDNPFVGQFGVRPEIYSYGHRNPQGMALDPVANRIWLHEHGPMGGDELNILRRGGNYGWPVVSHGEEYGGGAIGEGTSKEGMIDPEWTWVPSIAPSGLVFYSDDRLPLLQNRLLVGALKFRLVAALHSNGSDVHTEQRWFENELGRIRDIRVGPNGLVYLLTDESNGRIIRLDPIN